MTNGAAFFGHADVRPRGVGEFRLAAVLRNYIYVFVMRKRDREIRCRRLALWRRVEKLARVREWMSRTVIRRRICVTDRTDHRRPSLKELLTMAADTRFVARIISHVGKGIAARAHFVPIVRRKFVTV